MKTNIRFNTRSDEIYEQVKGAVNQLYLIDNPDIYNAIQSVNEAFENATDGLRSPSSIVGKFYAYADISTGEFQLYKNVE